MLDAVISRVFSEEKMEVVYIDRKGVPIGENVILIDFKSQFEDDGPNGIYAENSDRLGQFVRKLKAGRY